MNCKYDALCNDIPLSHCDNAIDDRALALHHFASLTDATRAATAVGRFGTRGYQPLPLHIR